MERFFGIGVQKGGTTWLHHMLAQHPKIFLPKGKELHYFDNKKNFLREDSFLDYLACFDNARDDQIIGEITPGYFWTSQVNRTYDFDAFRENTPIRLQNAFGLDLKFLLILRDPTLRAISAYIHHLSRDRIKIGDRILDVGRKYGILSMGFYSLQIERWFDVFNEERFFFCTFADLQKDKLAVLERIYTFLNVEGDFEPMGLYKKFQKNMQYWATKDGVFIESQVGSKIQVASKEEIGRLKDLYSEEYEFWIRRGIDIKE